MVRQAEFMRRVSLAARGTGSGARSLESQYFARTDPSFLRTLAADAAQQKKELKQEHGQERHWRVCPSCGARLREENLAGVLIDACPACGGMWFDRGEFELLRRAKRTFWSRLQEVFRS